AERQILARLSHPHIAHLLDGGTTEHGSPYLVMEYIEGQPIDEYCSQRALNLSRRLDLFRTLCLAVHYVHQHLMVHGDIKGSNVLVTASGVVKLLDFGIAKLLHPTATLVPDDRNAAGFLALTPEYASPEQVRGEAITTASDVYSLGVLLYRLLAGELPYKVTGAVTRELATQICNNDPAPPSVVAARQESLHAGFARELGGDLDSIVGKALKKDPDERYSSAEQFAQDIRSYLRGFPVAARPETTRYRVRKFAQRNKAAAAGVALFVVALVAGIVTTSWQAHVARLERARAERHFKEVRELTDTYMLDVYNAVEKLAGATAVRRLLIENSLKYLSGLEKEASDSEELQRDLAYTYEKLGDVQGDYLGANLGDTEGALQSYRRALSLREALVVRNPTAEHKEELLRSHVGVSELLMAQSSPTAAMEHARAAIRLGQELVARADATDLDRRYMAAAYVTLGWELGLLGQTDAGMKELMEARTWYQKVLEAQPRGTKARRDMGLVHSRMGDVLLDGARRPADALPYLEQASSILEPLTVEFPDESDLERLAAFVLLTRAEAENQLGRPNEALTNAQVALQRLEHLQHSDAANEQARVAVAYALGLVGDSYAQLGQYESALQQLNRAATIVRSAPPAKPTDIAEIRLLAGSTYVRLGKVHASMAATLHGSQRTQHLAEARDWSERAISSLRPLTSDTVIGTRSTYLLAQAEAIAARS
ncbi:MAG TPA: protein kinase, partial [Povalibacter sp.]